MSEHYTIELSTVPADDRTTDLHTIEPIVSRTNRTINGALRVADILLAVHGIDHIPSRGPFMRGASLPGTTRSYCTGSSDDLRWYLSVERHT